MVERFFLKWNVQMAFELLICKSESTPIKADICCRMMVDVSSIDIELKM